MNAAGNTYDRDEAGGRAAEKLAEELSAMGIEVMRVLFPKGMDANEYALKLGPAEKSLGLALRQAQWMAGKREMASVMSDDVIVAEPEPAAALEPAPAVECPSIDEPAPPVGPIAADALVVDVSGSDDAVEPALVSAIPSLAAESGAASPEEPALPAPPRVPPPSVPIPPASGSPSGPASTPSMQNEDNPRPVQIRYIDIEEKYI